jgi:mitochondrial fission protein ELM1
LIGIYEKYLRQYPYEYLWTYKIYKHSKEREILILSDAKTGHLRQSEGLARLITQQLTSRGIKTCLSVQKVEFRRPLCGFVLGCLSRLSGKYPAPGNSASFLRYVLTPQSWQALMRARPDIIISAGASTSAVNYFLSKENQAKSVVLMRPGYLSLKKFDLVVMPRHDRPPQRSNVVVTEGALNLIDAEYLNQKAAGLKQSGLLKGAPVNPCVGVLIGGDSKKFSITPEVTSDLSREIKKLNADILISTSRRSPLEVEEVVKNEFSDYARCKLLVIANQNNHPDAVGGILGLSKVIIVSPESISMISEAVCANKYVVVFKTGQLSFKHRHFLKNYQEKEYIYLEEVKDLASRIAHLLQDNPLLPACMDNLKVMEGLSKIL